METNTIIMWVSIIAVIYLFSFKSVREKLVGCLGCLGCGGCLGVILLMVGVTFFGPLIANIIAQVIVIVGRLIGRSLVNDEINAIILEYIEDLF